MINGVSSSIVSALSVDEIRESELEVDGSGAVVETVSLTNDSEEVFVRKFQYDLRSA